MIRFERLETLPAFLLEGFIRSGAARVVSLPVLWFDDKIITDFILSKTVAD
jgi:hypothetical protein